MALRGLDALVATEVERLVAEGLSEEVAFERVLGPNNELLDSAAVGVEADLRQQLPAILGEVRQQEDGFLSRNRERWKPCLEELELMYLLCAEFGDALRTELAEQDPDGDVPYAFEALESLFTRALQSFKQIIWLIEGGFADGALAAWRTLHELAVISLFLSQSGEETCERYIASFHCVAWKAAQQFNEYADRANLAPFDAEDMAEMKARNDSLVETFGQSLANDYGWASVALGKEKPTFHDIEKATKLDHWRPRFKWASQGLHGPYRPAGTSLGTSESRDTGRIVGRSNSGMVDPIHMSAITLNTAAVSFLLHWESMDHLVACKVLGKVANEIGELALKVERETLEAFNRAQKMSGQCELR